MMSRCGWLQPRLFNGEKPEIIKNEEKTIDQNRFKTDQKSSKNRPKHKPKIDHKSTKINQKSTKNRGLDGSGAGLEASWAGLGGPRRLESYLGPFWNRLGGLLGGLGPRKVANMGPTWLPKWSQNQLKIGPKIDQFYDASWNRYFSVFQ